MSPFLQICLALAILLFSAKAFGYLSTKIKQPSVFGELLVGILLGPSLINLFSLPVFDFPELPLFISELGELGVLLLMFIAGMELNLSDLTENKAASAYAGILGVLLPVFFGFLIGKSVSMGTNESLFLGLTLGATSVSISAQTLIELKALKTKVGFGLLGAAVFDDIIVILLVSGFLALSTGGNGMDILIVLIKMILFLLASLLVGYYLLPLITRKVHSLAITQGSLTLALVIMLLYGIASEYFGGMAAITGTFIAGLMYARTREKQQIERGLKSLAYSFFVPIFFINIGLNVNILDLEKDALWLFMIISLFAILGKIIGSGLGAKLGKYSWLESLQLGIGMVSRGEVGLIVASIGIRENLLTPELYSIIVGMILVTTLVTPPLLRASFRKSLQPEEATIP